MGSDVSGIMSRRNGPPTSLALGISLLGDEDSAWSMFGICEVEVCGPRELLSTSESALEASSAVSSRTSCEWSWGLSAESTND